MGVIEDAARGLGQAIQDHNKRNNAQVAYVRKVADAANHWVEAELEAEADATDDGTDQFDLGKRINVWVWDALELNVGDPLFVQRRPGDHTRYMASGHQGYARGQRFKTRDPSPRKIMFRGERHCTRPHRVPLALADFVVLENTKAHVQMQHTTYVSMEPVIQFRVPPINVDQCEYQIWGYPTVEKIDYDTPSWVASITDFDITTKRWSHVLDLTVSDQAWLSTQEEILFVIAYVRVGTGTSVRAKDAGSIRQILINFT